MECCPTCGQEVRVYFRQGETTYKKVAEIRLDLAIRMIEKRMRRYKACDMSDRWNALNYIREWIKPKHGPEE